MAVCAPINKMQNATSFFELKNNLENSELELRKKLAS